MITSVEKEKTVLMPISVTCDVCGRSYRSESIEAQEFIFIRHLGGYMSIFGNGEEIECDICQDCLLEKLGNYLHSPPRAEEVRNEHRNTTK